MSVGSFNMNTWTEVSIDSHLFESSAGSATADYVLSLTMSPADIFTSAHYKQNAANAEEYDLDVELNSANLLTELGSGVTITTQAATSAPINSFSASGSAGALLLQVMSTKIFGHPKAAAAIANDDEYTTDLPGRISSGLYDKFNVSIQNLSSADNQTGANLDVKKLFEYYVGLGRVNSADDITDYQQMSFEAGDVFTFPFFLRGKLFDDDDGDKNGSPSLLSTSLYTDASNVGKDNGNGYIARTAGSPTVVSGTTLGVGEYEVPIKLQITIV